ncbi:uncharacterized protein FOMMEDRAFT_155615 [Fomitiporia mediterranea MF3/22]|uniref:uncharacterized protein n=1 Tax=Fomitiporia mediterranea (strain MF3/22) TaxID=694068 RepID=UPI0004409998|nr:uncharacterized protein FOMMEDRAFT_155615 [Fomitiporia mediterranea MF3/22]EJD04481.1 hypothetical protein FOMMEDRAFT_155615 [Fomitiporia mediterranea MF3/22]
MSIVYALVVLLNAFLVFASSVPPRPLTRIAHPTTLALEILPRHNTLKPRSSDSPFLTSTTLYHSDSFRLTLSAFGETFHLHLRPNDDLIHPAARINYFNKDGVLERTVPLVRESVRAYWGEVVAASRSQQRLREDAARMLPRPDLGWARILVHSQGDADRGIPPVFEGAFSVDGVTHNIQTRENYLRKRHEFDPALVDGADSDAQLVIWRDSDVLRDEGEEQSLGCLHDDPWRSPLTHIPWDDDWTNVSLARRDDVQGSGSSNNFESNIGQSTGCPSTQKILYMGVAADCSYVAAHGSGQNASAQIINNWNTASSLYKSTFNVSLGILHINVQDPECPSSAPADTPWNVGCDASNVTLNDRLSLFSGWRGQQGNDGAGLWHLMSGCPTGSEVGVAWLGTLCQQSTTGDPGSFVSGTAVSTNGRTEWEVVSHEIGHNFGAIHDCQSTCESGGVICCPLSSSTCNANDQYIMSPVTSSSQKMFSQCSLGNICSVMQSTSSNSINATCLQDPSSAIKTLSLNMCGNGIVEEGEDCDPGQNVTSSCCDSTTCKFKNGAQCDPASSPCCTGTCTFSPSSQVCRPAVDASCDIAEMCTGTSADCPVDVFQPNGQSCGGNGLACANGQCTSLSQQCQTIGASMNLTTACQKQDNSCRVSCEDPNNPSQCIQLQSQVIDGSPCGYGGTCQSGACQAGSALDTVKAWYVQNLQISIPVTVVAAIVVLLMLWALFICCRRAFAKKAPKSMEPALSGRRGARLNSWEAPPPGVQARSGASGAFPPVLPTMPFASRPPAQQQMANVVPSGVSNGNHRRASASVSIPTSLRPGGETTTMGNLPPSAYNNNRRQSQSQSWDAGRPSSRRSSGGSGGGNGGGSSRPGSGSGQGPRAREPAFPSLSAVQARTRTSDRTDRSNWVDPAKWNGSFAGAP